MRRSYLDRLSHREIFSASSPPLSKHASSPASHLVRLLWFCFGFALVTLSLAFPRTLASLLLVVVKWDERDLHLICSCTHLKPKAFAANRSVYTETELWGG